MKISLKRILICIFAVSIVAGTLFALSGCGKSCIHKYENYNCIRCGVTAEECFEFTYLTETDSYSVRCKEDGPLYTLKSISIPDTYNGKPITAIEDLGFSHLYTATEITIPNSITHIGKQAFSYCTRLTSVVIPDSVGFIGDNAFAICDSLTSAVLPDKITAISYGMFSACVNLKDVTIPDGVESIGDFAFFGCRSLADVAIPSSVRYIYRYAFSGCDSLTEVVIPDSVWIVANNSFENCASLTKVTIGKSVTSVGSHAFSYCASLTEITVDESNKFYKSMDGNLYSKDGKTLIQYAIGKKDAIFEIPRGVTSIGNIAFADCSHLTEVVIPDSVELIDEYAFNNCRGLVSAKFEDKDTWTAVHTSMRQSIISADDLADPAKAAGYLTYKYYSYKWVKK